MGCVNVTIVTELVGATGSTTETRCLKAGHHIITHTETGEHSIE
eukprot:SAG31_NODE_31995_length_361_cov_0.984733_1_plen_43_part_01